MHLQVYNIPTKNLLIISNGLVRNEILIFNIFQFFAGHRRVKGQSHNERFLLVFGHLSVYRI